MFVGEAPGFHEDKQGYPFVGQAGKLLDKLLGGIGLTRDQVYIANVLKCRPPGNRDPMPDEIEACESHLFRQISLIEPRLIATLGNFATKLLSGQQHGITRVHGRAQETVSRRQARDPLPALPSGRGSLHAGDAEDARGRLCAHSRAARPTSRCSRAASLPSCPSRRRSSPSRRPSSSGSSRPRRVPAMIEFESSSAGETERLAARLGAVLVAATSSRSRGELGAGKTTFVRGACRALGVTGPVTSPTFTIGHRYAGEPDVSHLDLYRFEAVPRRSGETSSRTSKTQSPSSSGPRRRERSLPAPRAGSAPPPRRGRRLVSLESRDGSLENEVSQGARTRLRHGHGRRDRARSSVTATCSASACPRGRSCSCDVDELLAEAGRDADATSTRIAVGRGPGRYTGLRMGLVDGARRSRSRWTCRSRVSRRSTRSLPGAGRCP